MLSILYVFLILIKLTLYSINCKLSKIIPFIHNPEKQIGLRSDKIERSSTFTQKNELKLSIRRVSYHEIGLVNKILQNLCEFQWKIFVWRAPLERCISSPASKKNLVEAIMFHQPPIVNWCCNAFYVPSEQLYIYTGYLYHQLEPGANVSISTTLS